MSSRKKAKGAKRLVRDEEDAEMEDEIAQGLDDVERQSDDDFGGWEQQMDEPEVPRDKVRQRDADDSAERQRPKKKARNENAGEAGASKKPKGRPRKDNVLKQGTCSLSISYCIHSASCSRARFKRRR